MYQNVLKFCQLCHEFLTLTDSLIYLSSRDRSRDRRRSRSRDRFRDDRRGGGGGMGGGGGGGGRGGDRGGRRNQAGSNLRKPRWDISRLEPFKKDFYVPQPSVANRLVN